MSRIFEPFFTTKAHGMGMGLSICHSIIELHGGQLQVSPRSPHGSIFCARLPICRVRQMLTTLERERLCPFLVVIETALAVRRFGLCGLPTPHQCSDQVILVTRLGQISDRAALSARALAVFRRETGNEYHRHTMTVGDQAVLQFHAAQAWHLDIGDQARRRLQMCGFEEFLGRTERHGFIAERPDKGLCGFPDGFIVVNDRNHRHLLQFYALEFRWITVGQNRMLVALHQV